MDRYGWGTIDVCFLCKYFPFVFHFSVSFVYSLIFACIGVHEANHCKALVNLILSYNYGLHFTSYIYVVHDEICVHNNNYCWYLYSYPELTWLAQVVVWTTNIPVQVQVRNELYQVHILWNLRRKTVPYQHKYHEPSSAGKAVQHSYSSSLRKPSFLVCMLSTGVFSHIPVHLAERRRWCQWSDTQWTECKLYISLSLC